MSGAGETRQHVPSAGRDEAGVGELRAGETVLMIDSRQRRYLIELRSGGEFHTHAGVVPHDEIIGSGEGSQFRSGSGARFVAMRPTLADLVLKMPRGAQVIYPKDLGAIWMLADVRAGMSVFETGVGSGALSATLLRSGALVTGYELREDFAERAVQNVAAAAGIGALDRYDVPATRRVRVRGSSPARRCCARSRSPKCRWCPRCPL